MFLVARADGALDCWDYLASQAAPALVLQVRPPASARRLPSLGLASRDVEQQILCKAKCR